MDYYTDVTLYILEYCDYVRLHALYCTSSGLSCLVDDYLRRKLHKSYKKDDNQTLTVCFFYHLQFLPVPGLIGYLQPNYSKQLASAGEPWIVDLYRNLSMSLLNWYGPKKIAFGMGTNSDANIGKGLKKCLSWKNDKSDEEVTEILKYLLENHLVPHFPTFKDSCKNRNCENHIIFYAINSGRVGLIQKMEIGMLTGEAKMRKKMESELLVLGIKSANIDMVRYLVRECNWTQSSPWKKRHLLAAIETSDEMMLLMSEMTNIDPIVESAGGVEGILKFLFTNSKKYDAFSRGLTISSPISLNEKIASVKQSPEKIIKLFYECWNKRGNLMALKWLIDSKILTNETAVSVLKPILCDSLLNNIGGSHTQEDIEKKMLTCKCGDHKLGRLLRDTYKFKDMTIYPTNQKPTSEMSEEELRDYVVKVLKNVFR